MPKGQLRPLRPACFLVGAGLLAYAGCSSTAATSVAVTHPTMIEVAPEDFLGEVPCAKNGPGLKLYVATLFDTNYVASGGAGGADGTGEAGAGGAQNQDFQLPSSAPTPCLAGVGFGYVVDGRHYRAEIDGYAADNLVPRASGSRQMVSPAAGIAINDAPLATARWHASCERAIAISTTIVRADRCKPFQPELPDANGSLRIGLAALLGELRCGSAPGEVDHLSVSVDAGDGQPREQTVACQADAEARFLDLPPRRRVSAYVLAFSAADTQAFAGTSCAAVTVPDASIDADCALLSQVGTLRVDLKGALGLLHLSCNANDLSDVEVKIPGDQNVQSFFPPDCLQPFEHGFAAGPAGVTVSARKDGLELGALTCHAEVTPGRLVASQCERIP
jgi:hypothetical protein